MTLSKKERLILELLRRSSRNANWPHPVIEGSLSDIDGNAARHSAREHDNTNSLFPPCQMRGSEEIIREAESLPVDGRLKVVNSLLRSLNPPEPEIDRRWIAEAGRRLGEIRSGKVQPVAGARVIQRLRERFPDT